MTDTETHECTGCNTKTEMWFFCQLCKCYFCDDCVGLDYELHKEEGDEL
jgi:hypothetical protein